MRAARPRWHRWLAIGVVVVALLVLAGVAALPLLVDSEAARRILQRQISALAGGEVQYEALSVTLFPRPRAEIRAVRFSVPGVVDGRVAALQIRIALVPMLTGDVRPVSIRAEQPDFEVTIAAGGSDGDAFTTYRSVLGPVVDALARDARGLSVEIVDGRLTLARAGRPVLALSEIGAQAAVSADSIDATWNAAARQWRSAQGSAKVAPGSLAASAKVQVSGLEAASLLDALQVTSPVDVRAGAIDATADAETDGRSSVRGTLAASTPQLSVTRNGRTLDLGALRIGADAARDAHALAITLRALQVGDLLPSATGTLRARPDAAAPVLELQVPTLDLGRLRDAALTLAGDLAAVRAAAETLQTGMARSLEIQSRGPNVAALGELRSLRAVARLEAATVALPEHGITVTGGAGRVELVDGVLHGRELTGAIGRSSFSAGTLALDVAPTVRLRTLDSALDADLAEALAIARRMLGERGAAALADVESVRGRASGRLAFETRRGHPHFALDVAKMHAQARYRGVPSPLEVSQGELRYAGNALRVRNLAGSVGRSSVKSGTADLVFGAEPAVRAATGDFAIVLDELPPWLASFQRLRLVLSDVKSVTGAANVNLRRLAGRLDAPAELDFEVLAQPREVRVTATGLPAPVTFSGGMVTVTPRTLRLDGVQISILDANVTATGTIEEYVSSARRVGLGLADARAGAQSHDWVRRTFRLPAKTMPLAPLSLPAGRVQTPGAAGGLIAAQGTVTLAAGARAEFDLDWRPDRLELRRLAFKDAHSDATLALTWAPAILDLSFKGSLDNRSLERIMVHPPAVLGALKGDFRASVNRREPRRSMAVGTLEAEGVDVLERWDVPIAIDRLRIEAKGDAATVREGVLRVAGERIEVTGTVQRKAETFAIDARITADRVDAARLITVLPREDRPRPGGAWDLPVAGRIAVAAKSIAYGERVFEPVAATASLARNRVDVDITDARLCGFAFPLTAVLTPGNVDVRSRIQARSQPVEQVARCLTREEIALTGDFDLDADLAASGPAAALARGASGNFLFTARNGRILRDPMLARILVLDQVSALLRGGRAGLEADGIVYNKIAIAGTLAGERLRIESGTLDSPSLGIAMTGEVVLADQTLALNGLVAPLGDVQGVLSRIPVVGRVFGARVLGIPVSVTGSLHSPIVVPLGPEAVGQSLVNLMSATFKAPIELLDPFLDRGRAKPQ